MRLCGGLWSYTSLLFITTLVPLQSAQKESSLGEWGVWTAWSSCSRPCGTGVTTRERACQHPHRNDGEKERVNCLGEYKQYQTCNLQACAPETRDFREVQCELYNDRHVGGRRYSWEPFYNGVKPCELACRAIGTSFYARMASVVADGTPCGGTSGTDSSAICVNGQCQRVGCDGVLGSDKALDKCGVCGGDDTTCHIISGIFTRSRLPHGYTHVARVPSGACRINVTQMVASENYLALRQTHGSYFINGDWQLSQSRQFPAAGSVVTYHRPVPGPLRPGDQPESIFILGPTNISLDVLVVRQEDNRGIMYSFTIPMATPSSHSLDPNQGGQGETPPDPRDNDVISDVQADEQVPEYPQYAVAPNGDQLNYKMAPRYVKPDYDNERFDQTQALGGEHESDDNAHRYGAEVQDSNEQDADRASHADRTRDYMRQLREQQRQREERMRIRYHAAQPLGLDPAAYNRYNSREYSSVPVADSAGPSLRTYDREEGGDASKQYYAGSPSAPRNGAGEQYYNGRVSGNQQDVNGYNRVYPQRGYSSPSHGYANGRTAYHQGANGGYTVDNRGYAQQYQQNGYQPNYREINGQAPQNYQRPGYSGSPYLNMNQAPVYIPPSNADQRAPLQGFQSPEGSNGYNPLYIPGNGAAASGTGSSVQLGTLDVNAEYSWKISGFTACSRTCGGGTQMTIIVCVKVDSQAVVTDENCDDTKPTPTSVTCNNLQCPPGWETGDWSNCSTSCDPGVSTRTVECRQRVSHVLEIPVSASRCAPTPRPESVRTCNQDKPCARWVTGQWGRCSAECGRGQRTRQVLCVDSQDAPLHDNKCTDPRPGTTEICDMGSCAQTWFFTAWTQQCSEECGEGVHRRAVVCGAADQLCSAISKPEATKACRNEHPCGGRWFTGPWAECSVSCGRGVRLRDVVCMKKMGPALSVLGEENCVASEKPTTSEPCDAPFCVPEWYMTEWSDCSRECGTGTQTREVKCMGADKQQSTDCNISDRPVLRQACNMQPCGPNGKGQQQDSGCEDTFPRCQLVVQARLCPYDYYRRLCCHSCYQYELHHPP